MTLTPPPVYSPHLSHSHPFQSPKSTPTSHPLSSLYDTLSLTTNNPQTINLTTNQTNSHSLSITCIFSSILLSQLLVMVNE